MQSLYCPVSSIIPTSWVNQPGVCWINSFKLLYVCVFVCMHVCVCVCACVSVCVCVCVCVRISPVYPDRLGRLNLRVRAHCFLDHWSAQAERLQICQPVPLGKTPTLTGVYSSSHPLQSKGITKDQISMLTLPIAIKNKQTETGYLDCLSRF